MKEYELGKEGEQEARLLLKRLGFILQSPDWIGKKENEWVCFEIKKKERYNNPDAHGLDIRQIFLREELRKEKGIRTYLLIFEVPTNYIFGQWIDVLEVGQKFDSKTGKIRLYPLSEFEDLSWLRF